MEARLIQDGSQDDPLMATVRCFADGDEEGHATRDNIRALVNRHAALHETMVTLRQELAEMTKDRDLWQDSHDEDCPNKAMVDEMRAELARERERHQWIEIKEGCKLPEYGEIVTIISSTTLGGPYQETCDWNLAGDWREAKECAGVTHWKPIDWPASLEPAPVATGEGE